MSQQLNTAGRMHSKGSFCLLILTAICFSFFEISCKRLIDVEAPITSVNAANVYASDATATAVLTGIYTKFSNDNRGLSGLPSLFFYAGLSSDELTLFNLTNATYLFYYKNALTSQVTTASFWNWIYPYIFYANSAIEGLNNSKALTPAVRLQLLGEAKFIRAFCYFYLVNLYGDVSLATSTDWQVNGLLTRSSKLQIWEQIITDLKDAESLLASNYLAGDLITTSTERVRPTKWAASALLARTYLYTENWINAENQATVLINNTSLFDTVSLTSGVFNKNSKEAIWQLQPTGSGTRSNTGEGRIFILPSSGPGSSQYPVYLSNNIANAFEVGDQRKENWVNKVAVGNSVYYYPYKYKIGAVNTSTSEYIMILRLSEQYLIRAEARAHLSMINEAQTDLNIIRKRASLTNTTANDKPSLLAAILHERKVEMFTEFGHRWLDLKRTGNIDQVLANVSSQKGGTWSSNWQWYPIPQAELDRNPNLVQNSGY